MRKFLILMAAGGLIAGHAAAQEGTVSGAAGGAVTGAIVGGPVGAAVGGVAGAIAGTVLDPPPERVVTYVQELPPPSAPVVIQEPVVVGRALPGDVVIAPVPDVPEYGYVIVGEQRLIVDPQTRTVIQIIE